MNKALEALNDLKEIRGWNDEEYYKRLDIIETELKTLEDLMKKYGIVNLSMVETAFISFITDFNNEERNYFSQIKDIEKELGIEISTLLNMQLYGKFYVKLENGKIEKAHKPKRQVIYFTTPHFGMMIKNKAYRLFYYHFRNYYFKDYGKTWSLNKKDLEKETLK